MEGWLISTSKQQIKSGVVLVKVDAIGDFIVWLDTARLFKLLYPDQKITLIANSIWSELAQEIPYWDEVLPIDINRFNLRHLIYRWKTMRKIAASGFITAIQPTYSRNFMIGDSIIRASRAKERIGSFGDLTNITKNDKLVSDRWYTELVHSNESTESEIDRNIEFMNNLSGESCFVNPSKIPSLLKLSSRLKVKGDYFVIFPGASWVGRRWPTHNFAKVIDLIKEQENISAVLCGSISDNEVCLEITLQSKNNIINLSGLTSLCELVEVIRGASMVISNETSAIHIAATVGTPSVCILGGGHYGRFLPYPIGKLGTHPFLAVHEMECFGCNWKCVMPHVRGKAVPCISTVSVDEVMESVTKILKSNQKHLAEG